MNEIKPIAMPRTHQKFLSFFESKKVVNTAKILDIGASYGAFSKRTLLFLTFANKN